MAAGQKVIVVEAMKMEVAVEAAVCRGIKKMATVPPGRLVNAGQPLAVIEKDGCMSARLRSIMTTLASDAGYAIGALTPEEVVEEVCAAPTTPRRSRMFGSTKTAEEHARMAARSPLGDRAGR